MIESKGPVMLKTTLQQSVKELTSATGYGVRVLCDSSWRLCQVWFLTSDFDLDLF